MKTLDVVRAGPLTTVQDLGRAGLAHLGVPRSGAVDLPALRLANHLVGNPEGYPALEVTLTGMALRAADPVTIAVTGAAARITVDGTPMDWGTAVEVPGGATVTLGPARGGVRSYLAVAGGIDVPPVLGSRATDTLSGLGPPPVRDGDLLPVGPPVGQVPGGRADPAAPGDTARVRLGPRDDWFTPEAVRTLLGSGYTVSPTSNRVGVRLDGPPLQRRAVDRELDSEGLVCGAVQVPTGGEPLVFLADHPTTGGYPVIAVVHPGDLPVIAQARPGTSIRFTAGTQ